MRPLTWTEDGVGNVTMTLEAWRDSQANAAEVAVASMKAHAEHLTERVLDAEAKAAAMQQACDEAEGWKTRAVEAESLDGIKAAMRKMSQDDRLAIIGNFCAHCGRYDADDFQGCRCWDDS